MSLKVGEILVQQKIIRPDQLQKALEEQKRSGLKLSAVFIQMGFVKEPEILRAMEKAYQVPGVDLNSFEIDKSLSSIVTREMCEKNLLIPLQKAGQTLVVAFSDPSNIVIREDIRFLTRMKIQPVVATTISIQAAIEKTYGSQAQRTFGSVRANDVVMSEESKPTATVETIREGEGDSPVVKFINSILLEAMQRKVSDIHFEPYEKRYRVRFRLDGNLVEVSTPPLDQGPAIASRLKVMSKMDIAEKRRPQDGRLKIRTGQGKEMDFRVNTLPTLWGEKVVLRLLDKSNLQLDMTKLGFEPDDLQIFKRSIVLPQGMVLITGPTGSGKTTTIYSALAELNKIDVNISTAEDPVEFNLEGINQVQMNADINLDFSTALKSFLRQDPDIIMVGEIRDLETAEISFKAASTGHLVVSTLHTNDAPSTIIRLLEMGIPPYLIVSCVNLVVAQRLVGKICESCKVPIEVPQQTLLDLGVDAKEVKEFKIFKGKGCSQCNNTGIRGRNAIYELLTMTERVKEAILRSASTAEIRSIAREEGLRTLRRSALLKLKRGITTIEDVMNSSIKDV